MKQTDKKRKKGTVTESKPRYTRIGFWFPLLYGAVNIFLLVCSVLIYSMNGVVANPETAKLILQAFQVCLIFSPSAFILLLFLQRRHRRRFPTCSDMYKKAPGLLAMFVVVIEVVYLVTLVM